MECEDSVRYGRCAQIWGSVNYPKLRNGHRHSQLEICNLQCRQTILRFTRSARFELVDR